MPAEERGVNLDESLTTNHVVDRVMALVTSKGVGNNGVDDMLSQVRAAASRPKFSFDSYYLIGLLEQLEEVARVGNHPKSNSMQLS